jgi:LPS sulfotransferase NodH
MFCARVRARQSRSGETGRVHRARTEQDQKRILDIPIEWSAAIAERCLVDLEKWGRYLDQYDVRKAVVYEDLVADPIAEYQAILDAFDIDVIVKQIPEISVKRIGSPAWVKDRFAVIA